MYSFDSRVRYSEVDKNKQLDLTSIINYFQDCSTFHSEDLGVGIDYLEEKKRAWLLNSWQIIVSKFPKLGDYITTSTWAYDFKSMYGYRNFIITDSTGTVCATANSIWVYMNMEDHKPARIEPEVFSIYGSHQKLEMEYTPRKIPLPNAFFTKQSFPVTSSNIDTNNHVNNGQYIKMAEEYLPEHFTITQMRAEYRMSAVLGDIIIPKIYSHDNLYTIVLVNAEDKPYTVIEFIGV